MKLKVFWVVVAVLMMSVGTSAHEIIKGTLKSSDLYYPGTERELEVYIPDTYDGSSDACVYVAFDGILCNAPSVMDSLIAAGKMPVTIGIFIQPGVVKDNDGNIIRYNRSNEFDTPSPKMAFFIENEVLPWVERLITARGFPVKLSHRAADRMIFGLSSGGIAAFTAAWHRPDMFSRVFSGVGTFVDMRGGNELQSMVRKSEPRPLRVFLQDGTNDVWNALFGHWYEGNRMLASALNFAGYDARYDWSDCYHGVKRASEIFADVMEWMWEGWPAAPKCGKTQNNLLDTMLVEGSEWRIVADDSCVTSGDVGLMYQKAYYPNRKLMAMHKSGTNCLWQYTIDESGDAKNGQPFYWLHNYDNSLLIVTAMTFDGAGDLWVVTSGGIQICDQNGRVRGIVMLPSGVNAGDVSKIDVLDGRVEISTVGNAIYSRRLNVKPAQLGITPKNQGQG